MTTISRMQHKVSLLAEAKGFHDGFNPDDHRDVVTKLCLIHSEVSEAMEEERVGNRKALATELADVVIRCLDLASLLGIELEEEILKKHEKNVNREHKHGGKLF